MEQLNIFRKFEQSDQSVLSVLSVQNRDKSDNQIDESLVLVLPFSIRKLRNNLKVVGCHPTTSNTVFSMGLFSDAIYLCVYSQAFF